MRSTVLKRVKNWVESHSGLQFSDALNVTLFMLTAMSFLIAAAGVYYAKVTLDEARAASVTQDKITTAAQGALDKSVDRLTKLNVQLQSQQELLDQSLKAAQQEGTLLQQSVSSAKQMTSALKSIEDQPNAIGVPSIQIECKGDWRNQREMRDSLTRKTLWLVALADMGRVKLPKNTWYQAPLVFHWNMSYDCWLNVRNVGHRALDSFAVNIEGAGSGEGISLEYARDCWHSSWQEINSNSKPIELIAGGTLGPSEGDAGQDASFCMKLVGQATPDSHSRMLTFRAAILSLGLVSNNHPEGDIVIEIVGAAEKPTD